MISVFRTSLIDFCITFIKLNHLGSFSLSGKLYRLSVTKEKCDCRHIIIVCETRNFNKSWNRKTFFLAALDTKRRISADDNI